MNHCLVVGVPNCILYVAVELLVEAKATTRFFPKQGKRKKEWVKEKEENKISPGEILLSILL